jgi:hypothetical protein
MCCSHCSLHFFFFLFFSVVAPDCLHVYCVLFMLMIKYHYVDDIIRKVFKMDMHFSNMKWENDILRRAWRPLYDE